MKGGAANTSRLPAFDFARGIAGGIMIIGHATHAWTAVQWHPGFIYRATRFFGLFPLPSFFLLAGLSLGLRMRTALARREPIARLRKRVIYRGLQLVLIGYTVNAAFYLLDGGSGWDTVLRVDVLHGIGLSLVLLALLCLRDNQGGTSLPMRRAVWWALLAGCLIALASAPLTRLIQTWCGITSSNYSAGDYSAGDYSAGDYSAGDYSAGDCATSRYALALLIEVDGIGTMPLLPLAAWACWGFSVAPMLARAVSSASSTRKAVWLLATAAFGVALTLCGTALQAATSIPTSRTDPTLVFNVVELAGRATSLVGLAALLHGYLSTGLSKEWVRLGRSSLTAYVFHIPFCYGAWGSRLQGKLSPMQALLASFVLIALSAAFVEAVRRAKHVAASLRARSGEKHATAPLESKRF